MQGMLSREFVGKWLGGDPEIQREFENGLIDGIGAKVLETRNNGKKIVVLIRDNRFVGSVLRSIDPQYESDLAREVRNNIRAIVAGCDVEMEGDDVVLALKQGEGLPLM